LNDICEGWDNRLFRFGDDLVVRVPRRASSATLIEQEQRWLPPLSPRLPLPIPVPRRVGRPGCGFLWSWSIASWFPGQSALLAPPQDLSTAAVALGQFLRALHQPAPEEAPHNPFRSVPLAARTHVLQDHLQQVDGLADRAALLELWERGLSAHPWSGPPLWIHGDLHPGNLLVSQRRLSAVIDFGDLAAGDPATDLSVMWMTIGAKPPAEIHDRSNVVIFTIMPEAGRLERREPYAAVENRSASLSHSATRFHLGQIWATNSKLLILKS
jgi:aminoglycoside phosphotransferase (APT) family kinase protein